MDALNGLVDLFRPFPYRDDLDDLMDVEIVSELSSCRWQQPDLLTQREQEFIEQVWDRVDDGCCLTPRQREWAVIILTEIVDANVCVKKR